MNFINKALAQLNDLFRSMTPGARITAGMLLVVIVVSVAYLFNHQFSGGDAYLFGGEPVAPSELPAMQAAFNAKSLTDYEIQGTQIRVPRSKQSAYMGALADAGVLPHNFGDTMKKMIDNTSPFVPRQKQQEMMKFALQDELSKIISKMSGIETAMVLYDEQNQNGLNPKKLVTASVSVKPVGNQPLTSTQVQMIRNLVAGAKVGLAPESISVIDLTGRAYPGGAPGSGIDASLDPYMSRKLNYEREFTESIQKAISFVSGAVVSVNVELHSEMEDVINSTKVDPKAVPIDTSETSKTSSSSAAQQSGRPGFASNAANAGAVVGAGANGSRTEDEATTNRQRSIPSTESKQVRMAGLTPKRVSVSVAVPSNYYEDVWLAQNPTPAGQQAKKPDSAALALIETDIKTKITNHVLTVLPRMEEATTEGPPQVVVTQFPHLQMPEIPQPSTADHAMLWLSQNASALGMGFLGIVSLLMVRSIVRSVPAYVPVENEQREPADTLAMDDAPAHGEEPAERTATPSRLRRRRATGGPSLRDELVEIVRDDPDAAANILRSWIGTAN